MLVIRNAQLQALGEPVRRAFVSRLAAYVRQERPAQAAGYDDEALEALIESGLRRSATYGITSEVDVARYVLTMFTLGPDFDASPDFAWTRSILDPGNGRRASYRTEQLLEEAVEWAGRSESAGRT